MKMFLIINIFIFSAMAVFLNSQLPSDSYSRVKYPQISLHSFKINKTTVNKIEKKVSKSIVHVKTSLNFTPVINEKKTTAKKINKVKFITLNNKEQLKDVENKKKIVEEDKVVNKQKLINKKVASTKLNLSYKEIEEQKAIIKKELKKVAWLDYKIINTDYSIKEEILLAKKVELKDRISTQISATEKSRVNNKIDVISQKETADELVFFDYSEDGKVSVSEVVAESTSND
ncbi:MAG: hypothetical protein HON90_15545, partial [Halobacteriovoraceae bacterium]|nr:hypothetical protein [Halobacteriovoraceae bacterium]